MKKIIVCVMAIILLVSSYSCASVMPPQNDQHDHNFSTEESVVIDDTLYTARESRVWSFRQPLFVNLPGMVLLNDQETHHGGIHLNYINKRNAKEYYFCFDALCNHNDCIGGYGGDFHYVEHWIWSDADQHLYATALLPSDISIIDKSDGNLYKIDIETQEYKQVYRGNGNPIRSLYANDRYIYLTRLHASGYTEIVRFDPIQQKAQTMSPPSEHQFSTLIVSGDTILVNFTNDYLQMYRTDDSFSAYEAVDIPLQPLYVDGGNVIFAQDANGASVGWGASARSICVYDMETEQTSTVISYSEEDISVRIVGYGGGYVYYLLNPLSGGTSVHPGRILYRVSLSGGEAEPMVNFGMDYTELEYELYVDMVCVYDSTIYCHLKTDSKSYFVDRYGILTLEDDGFWTFSKLPVGD